MGGMAGLGWVWVGSAGGKWVEWLCTEGGSQSLSLSPVCVFSEVTTEQGRQKVLDLFARSPPQTLLLYLQGLGVFSLAGVSK